MEVIYSVYGRLLRTYAHSLVTCYTSHFTFRAFYRQRQEGGNSIGTS